MRRGIFGGTFDPIHFGHIYVMGYCLEQANLDFLHIVVAGDPYQKGEVTDASIRLKWVKNSVEEFFETENNVFIDDREIVRSGPTYTIETLKQYKDEYKNDDLVLILGQDTYDNISTWKDAQLIEQYCELFVVNRDTFVVSSTQIRDLAKQHMSITGLVPKVIEAEIIEKKLYN
ncbi:MAG: nicotinate-nicotinamide nucleotide adenylyltransferase [Acidimicrobiia bacterium]